ncbi:MAG: cysteine-rich CWC family protein [Pseudomonadales bacterium]|nr:cysteine-rich CWC family protein [Pseudomonadales bacterium]
MTDSYKTTCPLCQLNNHCGMEQDSSRCWCMEPDVEFSNQLLEQVPEDLRDESCICENCVRSFHAENTEG